MSLFFFWGALPSPRPLPSLTKLSLDALLGSSPLLPLDTTTSRPELCSVCKGCVSESSSARLRREEDARLPTSGLTTPPLNLQVFMAIWGSRPLLSEREGLDPAWLSFFCSVVACKQERMQYVNLNHNKKDVKTDSVRKRQKCTLRNTSPAKMQLSFMSPNRTDEAILLQNITPYVICSCSPKQLITKFKKYGDYATSVVHESNCM